MTRKICVVVGSRANYSSIKSAMRAIQKHPELTLQLVTAASAMLERHGNVQEIIETDGFAKPDAEALFLLEGGTLSSMARSTGLGLIELTSIFERLEPDVVVTIGDRFETMATTLAAAYLNIPLAHTMGGEVSGNIDENIRHATTKFANIHFPASEDAKQRIIKLGENPASVFCTGCPRLDLVAEIMQKDPPADVVFASGVGKEFDLNEQFVIVSQHPVTSEFGNGVEQITETLHAVKELQMPALVLWPNTDAGGDDVARGIRIFREHNPDAPFFYVKNLPPEVYMPLMRITSCLIGNSSSAIREGAFIGTPAVNIGSRQINRERGKNIIDAGYDRLEILRAIQDRIKHGLIQMDKIYGDGKAGERIAHILATEDISLIKHITY